MRETVVGGDFRPSNAKKEKPHQNRAEAILGSQDLQKKKGVNYQAPDSMKNSLFIFTL